MLYMKTQSQKNNPYNQIRFIKKITLTGALVLLASALFLLPGCSLPQKSQNQEPLSVTAFKLNTVITITLYDSRDQKLLDKCLEMCDQYEKIFSRTSPDSELYQLNHRELSPKEGTTDTYVLSEPLSELISLGLHYSQESDGAFDIAIAPLTSLWDFTAEDPEVPDPDDISQAVSQCSYKNISLKGREITFTDRTTALDLGAAAKGYIADHLKEYLVSENVHSATIDLGGNVLCIGNKPDGSPFHIGIQKPFADRSETIAVMDIEDKSVVSSGIYERCFEKDGVFYHHLLDPRTGYPFDNDLISVTIICDSSANGDALSTNCFALGYEKGIAYAQSLENVQAVFITADYQIHYTEGFREAIPVTETQ